MKEVKVNLGERSYPIIIGVKLLDSIGSRLKEMGIEKAAIITDPLVYSLFGRKIAKALRGKKINSIVVNVPRGEEQKKLSTVEKIIDQLVNFNMPRDGAIIALGGGVIGDIAGFVAACYMRGIKLVEIPTTLLAMVDSAVGGKTGVNHPKGKNLIGAFYQPKMVLIDVQTLLTLPERELKTGLAEVVKYGVIEDDVFFNFLEKNSRQLSTKAFKNIKAIPAVVKIWETIIEESCKIKAKIVSLDEKEETGQRMVLNLGHTFGHAIETLTKYQKFNHGEAVSIGIAVSSILSERLNKLSAENLKRIIGLLNAMQLPTRIGRIPRAKIIKALYIDKKVRKNKVNFVLPIGIGKVVVTDQVPMRLVKSVLASIKGR